MSCMKIIPHDIIIDILYRLPAKSLARFRCVSNEWLSLLTDPRFIQTHQKTLNVIRFIFQSLYDGSFYSVSYNKHHETVSALTTLDFGNYQIKCILGSVHGLVLATANYKNLDIFEPFLVFNPTTKDYVELPISNEKQFLGMEGIGYDSVSHDYKVVVISSFDKCVYVNNLRTTTWKRATYSPYHHDNKRWMPGLFVNGYLHWIFDSGHSKPVIVAFSLADEKLSELQPPILYNEVDIISDSDTKLVALGEKLAIFHELKGDVWLMNEYGVQKSWTKMVVHGFNKIPLVRRAGVFYSNGKILFLTYDRLWIYDVEERTFRKSTDIFYMNIPHFLSAYVESLVSPKFSRTK